MVLQLTLDILQVVRVSVRCNSLRTTGQSGAENFKCAVALKAKHTLSKRF